MEGPWLLLASVLLLPPGGAADPLPTLAPPLTMVVSGQRRRLVVCVVSELPASSGHAVWISGGNGSALQSFAYGASQEEGGTVCAVSILPDTPLEQGLLACHVGPNSSAPAHSSSPIAVAGTDPGPAREQGCASGQQAWGPAVNVIMGQEGVCGSPLPPVPHPAGIDEEAESCPSARTEPRACAAMAMLVAARVVLLKAALLDALLTALLLARQ
ncbi:pre T-cell antigen receptor alpha isoform X1 [Numida meleagris]|uniref:pre T-cell antigen receptor alpha isoform X1 n=1 Tax=Numida meleagris TaxID=8996 RepID=UPI000B3DBB9E|nr:pre T-cell antigen receptor alpha isoform X1 [Numida meleagris]